MTTSTITTTENNVNVAEKISKFSLGIIMVSAAMIGIWGVVCLVGGLSAVGGSDLIEGFLTATGM